MIKEQPLTTDLIGDKTLKTDNKIEFFGSVDELSAFIMEFIHHIDDKRLEMHLRKIVSLLSTMMGEVAGGFGHIGELHLSELLSVISDYESKVGAFNGFCLPGETLLGLRSISSSRLSFFSSSDSSGKDRIFSNNARFC